MEVYKDKEHQTSIWRSGGIIRLRERERESQSERDICEVVGLRKRYSKKMERGRGKDEQENKKKK